MDSVHSASVETQSLRAKNVAASLAVIFIACAIYLLSPYNAESLGALYGPPGIAFTGYRFMVTAAVVYAAILTGFFLVEREPGVSKSLRFFRFVRTWLRSPRETLRRGVSREDRLAVLTTLLKSFYGPMMVKSLMMFCMGAWMNGLGMLDVSWAESSPLQVFNTFGFWFLMQVILFVDVFFFTIGYLVESRRLGNEIRSVDPTLVGWAAALLCYPPFNAVTSQFLGTQRSDFPQFGDPTVHLWLNLVLLALMAGYAASSAALGLKASNLTHRGVVRRGPYAVVRHPAYVCKNLAWWIGSAPAVTAAFGRSSTAGVLAASSVLAWSALYVLRALTEEDHLRRVDGEYADYAARVRYRFIPGVI